MRFLLAGSAPLLVAGCGDRPAGAAAAAAPPAPAAWLARGRVDVPGGLARVAALRPGRIEQIAVGEGQHVQAGDLLVRLDARVLRAAVDVARAEREQAHRQMEGIAARLPAARRRAQRAAQAAEEGVGSGQAADDARDALVELQQQRLTARAAWQLAGRRLEQAMAEASSVQVVAPVAGTVVQLQVHPGEAVEAQAPLMQLLPDGPRLVRAELDEALVGRVRPGMRAEVAATADERTVLRGRVLRIGQVFAPARATDSSGTEPTDARAVECWIELEQPGLLVGQRVFVRFLT